MMIVFLLISAVKLTQNLEIEARKLPNDGCVEVKWTKIDAGSCHVKYDVGFKNSSGSYLYNVTGYNIEEVRKCNLTVYNYITDVELTVSVNNASRTYTAKLVEAVIQPPSSKSGSTLYINTFYIIIYVLKDIRLIYGTLRAMSLW